MADVEPLSSTTASATKVTTTTAAGATGTLHLLTGPRSTFIAQGAEAKVYKAYLSPSDFPTLTLRPSASSSSSSSNNASQEAFKLSKADLKQARSIPFRKFQDSVNGEENDVDQAVPVFLKHRFEKGYRHPVLDKSLTKARVVGEARAIMKCLLSVHFYLSLCCFYQPGAHIVLFTYE
jgi:hypothetical protein